MADQTVTCPHCHQEIPLTQALTAQLSTHIRADLEQDHQRQIKQLEEQLERDKKRWWAVAQAKAEEKQGKQLKDLLAQVKEKEQQLKAADDMELALRKKTRQLEEQAQKQKLEMERQLDLERAKIRAEAKQQESEVQQNKLKEKDKQIEIMKKTIEDLKRQSEQGSMQIQGEVGEDALKDVLMSNFPRDLIEDVPTGIQGADLMQRINAQIGPAIATILWESKNTKAFTDSWLPKLKQDQESTKADLAILVSSVLPKDFPHFGIKAGVWVVDPKFVVPLATAMRLHLTEVAKVKMSLQGKDAKMDLLHQYLTGNEFRNRIENIVLTFMQMKEDLDAEKRSFVRIWSKREKQLEKVMLSTSGVYGDLQGIIGGALPQIEQLETESIHTAQIPAGKSLFDE